MCSTVSAAGPTAPAGNLGAFSPSSLLSTLLGSLSRPPTFEHLFSASLALGLGGEVVMSTVGPFPASVQTSVLEFG